MAEFSSEILDFLSQWFIHSGLIMVYRKFVKILETNIYPCQVVRGLRQTNQSNDASIGANKIHLRFPHVIKVELKIKLFSSI